MRDVSATDFLAVAAIVMGVWLLTNTLDSPNSQTWNIVAAVVIAALGLVALVIHRAR